MTEAMPFLQKAILLSYAPRSLRQDFFIRSVELEWRTLHGNLKRSACGFQCRRVRLGAAVGGEGEEVMLRPTMQARMLHKIHPTSVL